MSSDWQQDGSRTDKDYYSSRVEIANQGMKALLAINGGAAVSLLAFLQAVWSDSPSLIKPTLFGLLIYCIGVAFGAISYQLRVQVSLAHQFKRQSYRALNSVSYAVQIGGLVAFLFGSVTMVVWIWTLA